MITKIETDEVTAVLELEKKRYQAMIARDFETFGKLCHPDLVYTHSNGERDSLDSYLTKCKNNVYIYHEIDHPIEKVVCDGNTVIVVGRMNARITANGNDLTLNNNSIAVWVKSSDEWQLLAYQPTVLPK